jgi:hypothetical protein
MNQLFANEPHCLVSLDSLYYVWTCLHELSDAKSNYFFHGVKPSEKGYFVNERQAES